MRLSTSFSLIEQKGEGILRSGSGVDMRTIRGNPRRAWLTLLRSLTSIGRLFD